MGRNISERGPIGGGAGYTQVLTRGDHVATDLDSLLQALAQATQGQVVFIPGDAEIDVTTRICIEQLVLDVPQIPLVIRGVPEQPSDVHHNWFPKHADPANAVNAAARTNVLNNAYGTDPKVAQ